MKFAENKIGFTINALLARYAVYTRGDNVGLPDVTEIIGERERANLNVILLNFTVYLCMEPHYGLCRLLHYTSLKLL